MNSDNGRPSKQIVAVGSIVWIPDLEIIYGLAPQSPQLPKKMLGPQKLATPAASWVQAESAPPTRGIPDAASTVAIAGHNLMLKSVLAGG